MKKSILLIVIVLATYLTKAQSYVALENYSLGRYIQYMENFFQLSDGNILTSTRLFNVDDSSGPFGGGYGYCFLKVNREDASIMDSVFIPADHVTTHLFERAPSGTSNLFINQHFDLNTESSFLTIRHFDNDLVFQEEEEITVELTDTLSGGGLQYYLLDDEDIIMMTAKADTSWVFQRIGLDGTLKDRTVFPESVHHCLFPLGIKAWSDSPRQYVAWGYTPIDDCYYYVLDSLLNITESIALGHTTEDPDISWFGHDIALESIDESTYLLATPFEKGHWYSPVYEKGIQITKRDKATHANLKTTFFTFSTESDGNFGASPYVTGIKLTEQGYVYLAFGDVCGMNKYSVALLDTELNVLWQQYYLRTGSYDYIYCLKVLDDGGVGLVGFNTSRPRLFVLLISNDYEALEEQGIIVRPYACYPNPVRDKLHLQYSPDVKPAQIGLYDLQGRLVRSQDTGLENLDMEGLPAGTYTMRVTMEGGRTFSDKVVKE